MWLPSNEPNLVIQGNLKKSQLPSLGYLRVLTKGNEFLIFLKEMLVVGAWSFNIESFKECYENKALKLIEIEHESRIEIYEIDSNLFETIIELNEESKLSLPVEIDVILNRFKLNEVVDREDSINRKDLLSKYRINEPSEIDVENLLEDYRSKIGGG
ncbi:DUF2226 domain-containing protein [Methanobacterium paludis]|uniref:Uncharacterized protein n=1 Tax=Methanobacterium paludis (strain DSM 25820 / JCM 18151 / SWAN1) TaxID=868131 RepID=F6D6A1_METPW|nr:DUF2226 domain-containing protein [Methanobacterium paludis]AEG18922.1 hypothetical protein MSWAN_1913 [Methanobacterium paludis]